MDTRGYSIDQLFLNQRLLHPNVVETMKRVKINSLIQMDKVIPFIGYHQNRDPFAFWYLTL